MPKQEYPARDIKVFIWLGVAFIVLIFVVLPVIGIGYFAKEAARQQQCAGRSAKDPGCAPSVVWNVIDATKSGVSEEIDEAFPSTSTAQKAPGLGEEGSACGGPMRLPCMPGLQCESSPDEELGVCVKAAPSAEPYTVRKENEACGDAAGRCDVGLVCKMSPGTANGVCIAETGTAPKVLSLKLDGMQQSQGWYIADPGTNVTITVLAVNADSASVYLTPKGTETASERTKLLDLTKQKGGTFVGTFKVPVGLLDDFEVIVRDANGLESGMAVNVSATK